MHQGRSNKVVEKSRENGKMYLKEENIFFKKGQFWVISYGHDEQPCQISFSNSPKPNRKSKRQKAVYRLVTAPQGGTQKYTLAFAYDSPRWLVKQAAYRFSALDPGGVSGRGYSGWPSPLFWRALTASWRQKGKRRQIFPRVTVSYTHLTLPTILLV